MENVLQFPPPSLSTSKFQSAKASTTKPSQESLKAGKNTIQLLKQTLGTQQYKKLKSITRDFAAGSILPESYVDEAAALFDQGLRDVAFWNYIPDLITSVDCADSVDCAMRHLESVRMVNEMQELEFNESGGNGGRKKKPINYVLPAKKGTNSWGNNGSNKHSGGIAAAALPSTAIAKKTEPKKNSSKMNNDNGGSKKSRTKKKNNELKALAFGGI